jgi:hypothetical protein
MSFFDEFGSKVEAQLFRLAAHNFGARHYAAGIALHQLHRSDSIQLVGRG